MNKLSSRYTYPYVRGYINNPSAAAVGLREYSVASMLRGSVVEVVGWLKDDDYNEIPSVQATVDFVLDLGNNQFAVNTFVETDEGIEKSYFNLDNVIGIISKPTDGRVVLKSLSQAKREEDKADRGFDPAFFTPGTRCIVDLEMRSSPAKEVVVKYLSKNGANSYVLETGIEHEEEFMKPMTYAYNIHHVKRVLEHVKGPLVVKGEYAYQHTKERSTIDEDTRSFLTRKTGKANRYTTTSLARIVLPITEQYLRHDQVIDGGKLLDLVLKSGVVQLIPFANDTWYDHAYVANKKKLKRVVRRLLNKVLLNPSVEQEKSDEEMNKELNQHPYDRDED